MLIIHSIQPRLIWGFINQNLCGFFSSKKWNYCFDIPKLLPWYFMISQRMTMNRSRMRMQAQIFCNSCQSDKLKIASAFSLVISYKKEQQLLNTQKGVSGTHSFTLIHAYIRSPVIPSWIHESSNRSLVL